jgi:hypothetical protein
MRISSLILSMFLFCIGNPVVRASTVVHDPIHTVLNVAQQVYGQVRQEAQHAEAITKFRNGSFRDGLINLCRCAPSLLTVRSKYLVSQTVSNESAYTSILLVSDVRSGLSSQITSVYASIFIEPFRPEC